MSGLATCCFRLQILICDFHEGCLGCQHATLHGRVCAFDLGHVHEARTAPYQHAAWEGQFRNWLEGRSWMWEVKQKKNNLCWEFKSPTCLETSFIKGSGSICYPVATLQGRHYQGVMFPTLEFPEWAQVGISVVQTYLRRQTNICSLP